MPYELNINEITQVDWKIPVEMVVYGRVPVMISKQCVKKTYGMCDGGSKTVYLNKNMPVSCRCKECYNIIWSPKVLDLTSHFDKIDKIKPDFIRYDMPEVCMDRDSYNRLLKDILNKNQMNSNDIKWTGHFINKVD